MKGSRHQFRCLPFLRVRDVLNIRFHSLFFAAYRQQRIFSGYIWLQILMSAIDDPFPSPLIGERLGDFVLTIFGLYA